MQACRMRWNNRGEAKVLGAPPPVRLVHDYRPHPKYPWFCDLCGYAEHEGLKHTRPSPDSPSPPPAR